MKLVITAITTALLSTSALAHSSTYRYNNRVTPFILGAVTTAIIIDQYGRQRQVIIEQNPQVIISANPPVVVHQPPIVTSPMPYMTPNCTSWRETVDTYGRVTRERTCTENFQ